ncbi:Uncharacterized protein APZ42_024728 [Daphnia magna]|uniref:Reverse transcriptase domain-containing protein n=1 Tax=Daphnia magna TaxID=35525 RepID=A0A164TT36_9CRUS|nr:Uncharacterized protein APZ42_024728 [Daphnia magna]
MKKKSDKVKVLLRELANPIYIGALAAELPATFTDFLTRLRDLEQLGLSNVQNGPPVTSVTHTAPLVGTTVPAPPVVVPPSPDFASLFQNLGEYLVNQISSSISRVKVEVASFLFSHWSRRRRGIVCRLREWGRFRSWCNFTLRGSFFQACSTNQNGEKLSRNEHVKLVELLERRQKCFPASKRAIGHTTDVLHHIDTGDARSIKSVPYRVSAFERQIIADMVEEMLEDGIIEESYSPWSSPLVLIRKTDGRVLSFLVSQCLDLVSGYWQVPVAAEDREKTAFVTPDSLYQFSHLPFGLNCAPATFQRLMDKVLAGLKLHMCLVHLDDVLVFGRTFEQHLARLELVLTALEKANLTLNVDKCVFGATMVSHLGHVIDAEGIRPETEKVCALTTMPLPLAFILGNSHSFTLLEESYFRMFMQYVCPKFTLVFAVTVTKWIAEAYVTSKKTFRSHVKNHVRSKISFTMDLLSSPNNLSIMTISRALIDRYTGVIRETYNASILVIEGTGQCLGFRIFEVGKHSGANIFQVAVDIFKEFDLEKRCIYFCFFI